MNDASPHRVKAKITRTVTEIAIVLLDPDGSVEEVDEILDEIEYEVTDIHDIREVLSVYG